MSYRDDREALREQLESLRREVEALREESTSDDDKAKAAALRVNALSNEVTAALERIDEDRDVLKKLAGSLDGLKKTFKADAAAATSTPVGGASTPSAAAKVNASAPAISAPPSNTRLLVIASALIVITGFAFWASRSASPPMHVDVLHDLPGAPNAVDWLPIYARAEHEAEAGSLPTKIDIWYVKEDGTLDFTAKAYEPYVTLEFVGKTPPPPPVDSAIPLGAPVTQAAKPQSTCFTINKSEGFKKRDCGFVVTAFPLPRPMCSLRAIWAAARAAGAPSGAVAHLSYTNQFMSKRPAIWHFAIEHTDKSYTISDPECRLVSDRD